MKPFDGLYYKDMTDGQKAASDEELKDRQNRTKHLAEEKMQWYDRMPKEIRDIMKIVTNLHLG